MTQGDGAGRETSHWNKLDMDTSHLSSRSFWHACSDLEYNRHQDVLSNNGRVKQRHRKNEDGRRFRGPLSVNATPKRAVRVGNTQSAYKNKFEFTPAHNTLNNSNETVVVHK